MRSLCALALLLAACQFDTSQSAFPDENNASDAAPNSSDASASRADASPNAPDAPPQVNLCESWVPSPSQFDPCGDIEETTAELLLSKPGSYLYNTDSKILTEPGAAVQIAHTSVEIGGATAIVVGKLTINSSSILRATGSRPLMILSFSDINVQGTIDVSSGLDARGAGASPAICSANAAVEGVSGEHGAGGGGGGGFGSAGGTGGQGGIGRPEQYDGGSPGSLVGSPSFRGGCPGAAGGSGQTSNNGGRGGEGGGAVYLNARTNLTISGVIQAGGEGGLGGGGNRSAGGGGGSGGLVLLEAATLSLNTAVIAANGGGGGGGDNSAAQPGDPGQASDQVALGGLGGDTPQGDGGNGGFLTTPEGQVGLEGGRGGGGGGGGVGYIFFGATLINPNGANVFSPAKASGAISTP